MNLVIGSNPIGLARTLEAIAAGGRDNGAPGLREIYHPHYYGAFLIDPDGHNIEAVWYDYGKVE